MFIFFFFIHCLHPGASYFLVLQNLCALDLCVRSKETRWLLEMASKTPSIAGAKNKTNSLFFGCAQVLSLSLSLSLIVMFSLGALLFTVFFSNA